jgi:hypothetical protein
MSRMGRPYDYSACPACAEKDADKHTLANLLRDISVSLSDAGIGPAPIHAGVLELIRLREAAEARATAADAELRTTKDTLARLSDDFGKALERATAAEQERDRIAQERLEQMQRDSVRLLNLTSQLDQARAAQQAAEHREAEQGKALRAIHKVCDEASNWRDAHARRLEIRVLARPALASPSTPSPRPTHTADGKEILGWSAPQPALPIVRAAMRPFRDPDDVEPSTPSPAPSPTEHQS